MRKWLLSAVLILSTTFLSQAQTSIKFSGKIPGEVPREGEISSAKVYFFKPVPKAADEYLGEGKVSLAQDSTFESEFRVSDPSTDRVRAEFYFESPDYAPITAYGTWKSGGQVPELRYGPIVKKSEAARFSGVVMDGVSGEGIPFAGIYADGRGTLLTRADKTGRYEFWVHVRNGKVTFNPFIPTHVGQTFYMSADAGKEYRTNITLERGVRLKIKTVDLQGNPVPDVGITFGGGGGGNCRTDAQGNGVSNNKLSAYRATEIWSLDKKGWKMAQYIGDIYSGFYTDTPLMIVLKPTSKIFNFGGQESFSSQRLYQRYGTPFVFFVLASFFLYISLKSLIRKKPFLISRKWVMIVVVVSFIPSLMSSFIFSYPNTYSFSVVRWISPMILLVALAMMYLQSRGYLMLSVTEKSFRDALSFSITKMGYTYEEQLSSIRLMPINITFQTSIQAWVGCGHIKTVNKKDSALLLSLVDEMNAYFSQNKCETNLTLVTIYMILGVLMLVGGIAVAWGMASIS